MATAKKVHPRTRYNDISAEVFLRALTTEADYMTKFDRERFLSVIIRGLEKKRASEFGDKR